MDHCDGKSSPTTLCRLCNDIISPADRSCRAGRMGPDTMLLRGVNISALALLLCVQALHGSALPAVSSYEFTAFRMQQFNLAQQKHGRSVSPLPQGLAWTLNIDKRLLQFPESYFKSHEAILQTRSGSLGLTCEAHFC